MRFFSTTGSGDCGGSVIVLDAEGGRLRATPHPTAGYDQVTVSPNTLH